MGSRAIYKFGFGDATELEVVAGQPDRVVEFAFQHDQFCLWVECRPKNTKARATFAIIGTGHPIPDGATWIKSCLSHQGNGVWHLYQLSEWDWVN